MKSGLDAKPLFLQVDMLKPMESAIAILNYLNFLGLAFQKHQVCKPKLETPQLMMPYFALMFRP